MYVCVVSFVVRATRQPQNRKASAPASDCLLRYTFDSEGARHEYASGPAVHAHTHAY